MLNVKKQLSLNPKPIFTGSYKNKESILDQSWANSITEIWINLDVLFKYVDIISVKLLTLIAGPPYDVF